MVKCAAGDQLRLVKSALAFLAAVQGNGHDYYWPIEFPSRKAFGQEPPDYIRRRAELLVLK